MGDIALRGQGRAMYAKGGRTHVTKEGKTARKGLWYNIHQKRKRGEKMRSKGAKGAPSDEAIKRSQMKSGGRTAAWQRKEGKNPKGGLNAKGRASYKAETGGTLKAPSKKVGNPRRKSFCARMTGMRKRQKPSNNTGDDRLSKSLRAWNC
jgi:hypothetical protein|tara:strand:+ start:441 stop:890 length:450 start_codon:yes stop_codon:yes gene_type:complete